MASPKLRFLDCSSNKVSDWKKQSLLKSFHIVKDKQQTDRTILSIIQGKGTIPRSETGLDILSSQKSVDSYLPVRKDDFVIHLRSFQGGFEIANSDGIVSSAYTMLRGDKETWPAFFKYYFRLHKFINNNLSIVVEGVRDGKTINISQLSDVSITVPDIYEQHKIAEFFTALDEKIRLNATKLSNIRSLKSNIARTVLFQHKGIQLNSWVEVQLSDVAEFIKTRDTFDSCIYVGTEHLNKDFGGLCKEVKDTASGVVFKENDILLSNIRPYLKKLWLSDCKGVCSADVLVIRSKSTILPSLLKHILSTEVFFDYVAKGYKGSKMPRGDKDHIELFEFMIPSDLEIQRKIAAQLDLFEMMIFCLINKDKHLELLKKAFMQRMFV